MKNGKIVRLLAIVILLSLLLVVIPGTPALAAPTLGVSPASGAIGTVVTVTGENFDSYRGDEISMFFDNEEMVGSPIIVSESGIFSFGFGIPDDAEPGRHWVRAKSELGSTLAVTLFTVPEAEISLDNDSGTIGTKLTIEGKGFYAGGVVTLYYDNKLLATEQANSAGEFSYQFTILGSTAGKHWIIARGAEDNAAGIEFEVIPSITLVPASGAIGDILTVSGAGFAARSDAAVYFKSAEVAYAKTNEYGSFEVAFFNVPTVLTGTYNVQVKDEDDNMAKAAFTVIAGARLDQTTASVGDDLTISGTGFVVDSTVTIEYDGVGIAAVDADSRGDFEAVFKVPVSKYGEHSITVSDGKTVKQLVFAIESQAPPAPVPLVPADNSEARAEAYFDWEDVTDTSLPLKYSLQVATDRNFATRVLERELSGSEYALTRVEKLVAVQKDSPYYWRVKATDSAANEGEWSIPGSFCVLAPPAPALLLPELDTKAEAEVYFKWTEVTDLSPPIIYHLQVASDQNFASLVLEKKGLTGAEYTVTEEEKLAAVKKEVPYYWRVKAIDSVANEGEWSSSGSFYVGFTFPGWVIFLIIGLAAALVGFIAFLLGRRTAYSQPA